MKLWRMRATGKLRRGVKIGGTGKNLTTYADALRAEGGPCDGLVSAVYDGQIRHT